MCNCYECGSQFKRKTAKGRFCCSHCRVAFSNREMQRGQLLYRMMMESRFNRGDEDASAIRSKAYTLISTWRQEDREERKGRVSWLDPREWLARNPWLSAQVMVAKRRSKA